MSFPTKTQSPPTKRQKDVLRNAAMGMSREESAAAMGINACTVDAFLSDVKFRLGAKTTTQAVVIAMKAGMLGDV